MCTSATGPLRGVAVVLLVGLTWFLASTIFGGDSGSSVRHFFTGKLNQMDTTYATCHSCMVFVLQTLCDFVFVILGASEEPTAGQSNYNDHVQCMESSIFS